MVDKKINKILWHDDELTQEGKSKAPKLASPDGNGTDGINRGEIYIGDADEDPSLFIRTNKDNVVRIGGNGDSYTREQINDMLKLKVDNAFFSRLFGLIDAEGNEIDVNNLETVAKSIQAKLGMWTEEYLSAKGKNPDSGSIPAGATKLSELTDVSLSTILDGQSLVYDLSLKKWVNRNIDTGGIDEEQLAAYLTENDYAKKGDIPSLEGYATEEWVTGKNYATVSDLDSRINDLVNGAPAAYDTLKEIADVLQGNVDSIGDIITTLGTKADKATTLSGYGITDAYTKTESDGRYALKTITISAGTGLSGGGNLSANRTLSLATVGKAGTYTKVTVDAYGRVTSAAALSESDIPALSISKVTGLQAALDKKLDTAVFDDLFEKVEISEGVYAIRAKYGLYSDDFISAKGKNPDSGSVPSGATALNELSDVSLGTLSVGQSLVWNGTKWTNQVVESGLDESALAEYLTENNYAKKSDIPSLTGYATQSWVNTQLGSYATTAAMNAALSDKVDKVDGKGLSSNDFTDALLSKLNGIEAGANKYVLPTASSDVLGGVKVGATLSISSGVLNLKNVGTAGTYTKVTTNAYGQVTSGTSLSASDIPGLPWSKITSGKPTTLAGYGITDGVNDIETSGSGNVITAASVSGHTITLTKGLTVVSTSRTVTAGAGLTGGGALSANITLNVVSANAGITVNADNIQLNTVNNLTSTDTVKPLSAAQGKVIWDFVTDLFEKVNIGTSSSPVYAIRAKYGLYTDSFLSAKGMNDDSGSSVVGATNLSELDDVSLGTLSANQILAWNGSKWTNVAMPESGASSWDEITGKPSWIGASKPTYTWSEIGSKPTVFATNIANISDLHSSWDSLLKAAPSAYVTRWPTFAEVTSKPTTLSGYGITDAYTKTDADGRYVNVSGDTMTGALNLSVSNTGIRLTGDGTYGWLQFGNMSSQSSVHRGKISGYLSAGLSSLDIIADNNNVLTVNGSKYWNAANDGSGSGLDADLLDGYHESSFFRNAISTVDESVSSIPANRSGSYILTHSGWNGSAFVFYAGNYNSTLGFMVPGGQYDNVKLITCTDSNAKQWKDKGYLITSTNIGSYNAGSATKLQTARTIWGQSFNGTADVSGNMTGVGSINGRLTVTAQSDTTGIGFGGVHSITFQGFGIGYAHTSYYFRPSASTSGTTQTNVYFQNGTKTSDQYETIHSFDYLGNAVHKGYIQIGDGRIKWDSTNNALYVEKSDGTAIGFYSKGWISAKGDNPDAGGSVVGATSLSELSDVSLGTLANGQSLVWNGSKWVNSTINTGLDTEELAQYLTSNKYATQSWVTGQGYLKSVSLSTISDLHSSWDALLKAAPSAYVTRWPTASEVGALTQTTADGRYIRQNLGTIGKDKDLNDYKSSGLYIVSAESYTTIDNFPTSSAYSYGTLASLMWESGRGIQWYVPDYNHTMAVRTAWNAGRWNDWNYLLTNLNYTSYTVTKTGSGASGTWGIGITGNAATATKWATARTITLTGDVTGSVSIDGSANKSLSATVSDNVFKYRGEITTAGATPTATELTTATSQGTYRTAYSGAKGKLIVFKAEGSSAVYTQIFHNYNGSLMWRSSQDSTLSGKAWRTIWDSSNDGSGSGLDADLLDGKHYTDIVNGNVASATKLATARTLWGQSFNGTANVSGSLSSVANISMTGTVTGATDIIMATASNGAKLHITGGDLRLVAKSSGAYANSFALYDSTDTNYICNIAGCYGSGNTLIYNYYGGNYDSPHMVVLPSGNVGIGTTSPSYKLHVAGTGYFSTADLGTQIIVNRSDNVSLPSITYKNNSGILGRIGVGGSGNGDVAGHPCFASGTSTTLYKIWHAGNDGSGSGLDADMLDGKHLSSLNMMITYTVNLSSLSKSYFYPLVFGSYDNEEVEITSPSASGEDPYNCNTVYFQCRNGGWSDRGRFLFVINNFNYAASETTIGNFYYGTHNGGFCVMLRGGMSYTVKSTTSNLLYGATSESYGDATYTYGSTVAGGTHTNTALWWTRTQSTTSKMHTTQIMSLNALTITDTTAKAHLAFSRAGYNYLTAPGSGNISFVVNGQSVSEVAADLIVENACVRPGSTNATSLGNADRRWSNVYSVNGDFSGTLTLASLSMSGSIKSSASPFYIDSTSGDIGLRRGGSNSNGVSLGEKAFRPFSASSGASGITCGNSSYRWANVYSVAGNFSGAVTMSSTLSVTGAITGSSTIYAKTGLYSDGYVSAKGQNTSSDMRLKNRLSDICLSVKQIADAPSMRFAWRDGRGIDVGSSAQYWERIIPDAVKERNGYLEMAYGNIALISAISLAKHFESLDERVERLEKENKQLKKELSNLKRRIAA